jgi:hypothetical protein
MPPSTLDEAKERDKLNRQEPQVEFRMGCGIDTEVSQVWDLLGTGRSYRAA